MGQLDGVSLRASDRSVARLAAWTFAWLASLALARFGPSLLWPDQPVIAWVAIIANLVVGIGWIAAHARFVRDVDELQRKVMLDAMAIALGAGLVGGCTLAVVEAAGLVAFDATIALLIALMAVVYVVAIAIGNLRYR